MTIKTIVALALSAGCRRGARLRRATEKVVVNSDLQDATIRISLDQYRPQSAGMVQVSRKAEFTAFADKAGHKPGQIYISIPKISDGAAGLAGNILAAS